MQATTLKELEWIHDCALLGVLYDTSSDAGQSIRLTMRCPTDLGYAPWAGKTLVLAAIDVAMSKHIVCGVAGCELNRVRLEFHRVRVNGLELMGSEQTAGRGRSVGGGSCRPAIEPRKESSGAPTLRGATTAGTSSASSRTCAAVKAVSGQVRPRLAVTAASILCTGRLKGGAEGPLTGHKCARSCY
jgi:hypothetical protein